MKRPFMVACLVASLTIAWQTPAQQETSVKAIAVSDIAKTAPPQVVEPCLKEARRHDFDFDEREAPSAEFTDWLAGSETTQIPWKVQIKNAELRIDQRYEVSYSVTVQGKDLETPATTQEILYTSTVTDSENRQILQPRWSRHTLDSGGAADITFRFTDCVFLKPGNYFVWMAVYDPKTGRHSVAKRRIRAPEFSADLLPKAHSQAPAAEFPEVSGSPNVPETPGPIFLPISNKQPLAVEIVSALSPLDQWDGRDDIARAVNNRVLAAIGIFSQLQLAAGSASVLVLDPVNQSIAFQQDGLKQLDWADLAAKFTNARNLHTLTLPALQAQNQRSAFVLAPLRRTVPGKPLRVIILISGSLLFERGHDASSLRSMGDCRCKVYHVRLQATKSDVFDDLERAIKPLRPKTFDVMTPQEFRKTLAAIVEDLNHL